MFRSNLQPLNLAKIAHAVGLVAVFFWVFLATAQAATIKLAWDTVAGATGYRVHYGTTSSNYNAAGSPVNVVGSTTTSVTIPDGVTYYFAVKAYDSTRESGFSNEINNPIAKFSASKTTVATGESLQFTDSSTGTVTSRVWNFGDGTTSTQNSPVKSYAAAGTYPVSLTVTGLGGITHTATQTITVNAPSTAAPVANFTASPISGDAPLSVTLTDTSTGSNIAKRTWNFGDGTTTTVTSAQTFVKTYAYGTYTVSLTLKDSTDKVLSTYTYPQPITAKAVPPAAKFSASPTSGTAPLPVTFANQSTGTNLSYAWDFGVLNTTSDTSTAQNPSYQYDNPGTYTVTLTATGVAGTTPSTATQTITVSQASANTGGLVAAYNFQEGTGTTVQDASGQGNHGTLSNASWTNNGQFGKALSFNGSSSWVTVADKNSLDLTNGMTLEAWVYPTATMSGWRNVLLKERTGGLAYGLYANSDTNRPVASINIGGNDQNLPGTSALTANTWVHLAATYDGATERLFVNGTQVASRAQTGNMPVSTGALRIGGNSVWGEYFQGRIDEVRIYNRALSAAEIQTDMTSLPPTRLLGDPPTGTTAGTKTDPITKGTAKAFLKKADKTGTVTSLSVYVVSGSTALVAGLYANDSSSGKNRPGTLIAQATLSSPKAGWNHVSLPAKPINAGTTYWIAILSPGGELQVSDRVGGGTQPSETSPYTTSTTLPTTWWTSGVTPSSDGPVAGYGAGY
jgi:PKD repeat protein